VYVKLSVGVTGHAAILEIEGLFTQGSRPGRTLAESVGGIFAMDSSDWSNGIRYHIFDTRPDTEFKWAVAMPAIHSGDHTTRDVMVDEVGPTLTICVPWGSMNVRHLARPLTVDRADFKNAHRLSASGLDECSSQR
jgi:hypothetical protein